MSTITTRSGKGSPLTHDEVDDNFTNLNTDKLENINSLSVDELSDVDTTTVAPVSGDALVWDGTNFTPSAVASGNPFDQSLNTTDSPTFVEVTADEFIGNTRGANLIQAQAGEALTKGDVVYISGISGNTPIVMLADADDAAKMPAVGLANATVNLNASVDVLTFGQIDNIDTTKNIGGTWQEGDSLYVNTVAGQLTKTPPTGENSLLQKIAKIEKVHASTGLLLIQGAGRTNATPNLNQGNIFIGDATNQSVSASLDTSVGAAGYLKTVAADSTPSLGGILDTSDYAIRGTTIPIELQNGVLIGEDSAGDYALNIDHTNTTGRGIQVRQGISGTPHTSGQLMRLRSADAIGFAERFKVDYDGSVKINNAYTFPLSDGSANQVLTTDGFGNLSFATPAPGYSDSDVDTHLNTSTATTGQVLSWTGTDYDWITGGGGGSFTGDLLGNSLTDSTQAVTISSLKGGLSHTSLTGQSIATNTSIDLASGSDLNVDVKNGYIRLTGDITNGTGATFDRSYHIFDTQGYNYNASDRITGFRVDVRHGNSDFATNGQGNIKEIFGSIYDLMRNYNGSSDNTIENIVGMRQRIRANFDTTNLNSVEGIQLQFDSGLSNSTTLKSITTNNADAVMSHWGPIEVGAGGEIVVGDGNNASIKIANKLNQTAAMVQKNVNNNPNFNPIEKVAIDQNITDSTYVVNETERGYFTSHSTRATVVDKFQAPTASSTTTPQVGYGQELTRPVYNPNSAVTSTISDTLYSFSRFGSSGFWLSNGNINVPARQSISFGFPIQFQQGFDNPFVGATGGTAVNNLLTETGQMPTRVVFSYNTGSVANFDAISDTAWTNTEMGTLNSVYDKIWSFGCSFRIQLESSIPSNAANATVVVNKALPPSGVIAAFPGDPNGFVPLYANVPSWMNTSTRALTMTRPATGKTFYRWTIEFSDSTIFAKDFEEFNLS